MKYSPCSFPALRELRLADLKAVPEVGFCKRVGEELLVGATILRTLKGALPLPEPVVD